MPPIPKLPISHKEEIVTFSRTTFAQPRAKVEEEIKRWHEPLGQTVGVLERREQGSRQSAVFEHSDRRTVVFSQSGERKDERRPPAEQEKRDWRPQGKDMEQRAEPRGHEAFRKAFEGALRTPHRGEERETELRKAISLNYLKPDRQKKERSPENVKALRAVLSNVIKDLPPEKPEHAPAQAEVKPPSPASLGQSHFEEEVSKEIKDGKERPPREPAGLPDDVLRKILEVDL